MVSLSICWSLKNYLPCCSDTKSILLKDKSIMIIRYYSIANVNSPNHILIFVKLLFNINSINLLKISIFNQGICSYAKNATVIRKSTHI